MLLEFVSGGAGSRAPYPAWEPHARPLTAAQVVGRIVRPDPELSQNLP